jgi:hypothetical protein
MEKSLEKASTEVDKKSARIADIDTLVDFGSSSDKLVEERSKLVEQIKLIKDKKKQLEIDITTAKTIKPTIDANTKDREPYSKAVNDARKTAYEKNVNLFSMVQDYVKSEPLNGDLVKSVGLLIKDDGTRHYLTSTDGDKPRVALVNTETFTLLKLILAHEVDKLKSKK